MRKTFLSALLGLTLTACDPVSSYEGTVHAPSEAIGKPLIIQMVKSHRLGAHGLPDPYEVITIASWSGFDEVRGTDQRIQNSGMGCASEEERMVVWVDMNDSEHFTRRNRQLEAPEGWSVKDARPDEGDWVASSEEFDFKGLSCDAGHVTVDLTLEPYKP